MLNSSVDKCLALRSYVVLMVVNRFKVVKDDKDISMSRFQSLSFTEVDCLSRQVLNKRTACSCSV